MDRLKTKEELEATYTYSGEDLQNMLDRKLRMGILAGTMIGLGVAMAIYNIK